MAIKLRPDKDVSVTKKVIKNDGHRIPLLIISPKSPKPNAPGVLWMHGGGYIVGMKEMAYMGRAMDLVRQFGAVVISPGYRLALHAPYPAALNDCYASLLYLMENAEELGVNPRQIMVGGESAGGGLCAAVCMLARERGEVKVAFQMPLYPMIDNLNIHSSPVKQTRGWGIRRNRLAWKLYLRGTDKDNVPPYAAPSRQTNYEGLPPTYTFIGTADLFYAETLKFIDDLKSSGVPASFDAYDDMFHAFDMLEPELDASKLAAAKFDEQFAYAVNNYFTE